MGNYLLEIKRISEVAVDAILVKHSTASELGELATTSESKPWETPVPQKIAHNDFPANSVLIRSNMLYIPLQGFSAKAVNHLKRIASFKNPKFYARQGMRLSTYNIPCIISCANMEEDYVALPRGCEDAVIAFLESNQVAYRIEDKTNHGENITVKFKGKLREEQKAAIASLTARNNGILNATTAFGKTVTAIGLIAERKVNTLGRCMRGLKRRTFSHYTDQPYRPCRNFGKCFDSSLQTCRYPFRFRIGKGETSENGISAKSTIL